jgi:formate dehydrogenase iron-sulfur subunit
MKAILHDVTRCTGCMRCVEACVADNKLAPDPRAARFERGPLSAKRYTTIEEINGRFVRRQCVHCLEPSCVSACLVGALTKRPDGPVVYDASKCIGCRYCMLSCPYTAIRYQWESALPFIRKCDLCYDRPEGPACVGACPHEATLFGEREELLAVARGRIRKEPARYIDHVFGEHEAGGSSVLYLSDVPLPFMPGTPREESIPEMTLPFAKATPFMAFGVASILVGTSFVIARRNRLAEERAKSAGKDGGGGGER